MKTHVKSGIQKELPKKTFFPSLPPPPPLSTRRGVHFGEAFLKAKAFKPEAGADSSAVPLAKRLEVEDFPSASAYMLILLRGVHMQMYTCYISV